MKINRILPYSREYIVYRNRSVDLQEYVENVREYDRLVKKYINLIISFYGLDKLIESDRDTIDNVIFAFQKRPESTIRFYNSHFRSEIKKVMKKFVEDDEIELPAHDLPLVDCKDAKLAIDLIEIIEISHHVGGRLEWILNNSSTPLFVMEEAPDVIEDIVGPLGFNANGDSVELNS